MSIKLYIEAKENETWGTLSRVFGQYVLDNQKPNQFGIVETDTIEADDLHLKLMGFELKQEYQGSVKYFEEWANSLGRVFGISNGRDVILSNGVYIKLPEEPKKECPPWLK